MFELVCDMGAKHYFFELGKKEVFNIWRFQKNISKNWKYQQHIRGYEVSNQG